MEAVVRTGNDTPRKSCTFPEYSLIEPKMYERRRVDSCSNEALMKAGTCFKSLRVLSLVIPAVLVKSRIEIGSEGCQVA